MVTRSSKSLRSKGAADFLSCNLHKRVHLNCEIKELKKRMQIRNHFMPVDLLESQIKIFEKPKNAFYLISSLTIEEQIKKIQSELGK